LKSDKHNVLLFIPTKPTKNELPCFSFGNSILCNVKMRQVKNKMVQLKEKIIEKKV